MGSVVPCEYVVYKGYKGYDRGQLKAAALALTLILALIMALILALVPAHALQ